MAKNTVKAMETLLFDTATLSGGYDLVGSLPEACFYIKIVNASDRALSVSYNGVDENDILYPVATLPNASVIELNFQTNALPNGNVALLAKGTPIYLEGLAGGTGIVRVIGYYQPN